MRLVKIVYNPSYLRILDDKSNISKSSFWYDYDVDENELHGSKNSLDIDFEYVSSPEGFINEDRSDITILIPFNIPEECIPYTKAYTLSAITNIERKDEYQFTITRGKVLRIVYDGPDEFALIWRLSIC